MVCRIFFAIAAGALLVSPGAAQMNPAAIGGGLVMPAAINAQAKRHAAQTSARDESAEEVCADLPNRRARLGARDPRIRKLARLCRQAGLPAGR